MLKDPARDARSRFVLVLDAIDRQRDAPPTLLPALARLSEIIPCLTCVFIVTAPPAGLLRTPASAHLHFPPYAKPEFVRILSLAPPAPVAGTTQQETTDLWKRFCAAVHDALVRSVSRSLPSFRRSCLALWPRFAAPVAAGTHSPKETSRCSGMLPTVARLLLLAAYLASHNATRHDLTLFSTYHHGRKRRRGGGFVASASSRGTPKGAKHRKIARKLLGAHAFVLERMLAIFEAVRGEWAPEGSSVGVAGLDGDVGMAMATLASLRLLIRVGSGDVTDRAGKWRINASWEAVRGIGRSIGVEIEEWLIE
ncbi:hypothetical protein HIM_01627 [Hirsutella minnesotensis 3608]|nr:hypothetical protein HIM_01627 [Hirsutella minnesotensis 3608]